MGKSGLFLVYKEENMTSRDVDNILKKKFNIKKIGHFGTLDPFAEGLLIIGINKGTSLFNYLNENKKEYIGKIKLGISTTTLDRDGEIIEKKEVPSISKEQILNVFNSFLGEQDQLIPKFSATKINGKEFYKIARKDLNKVPDKYKKINVFSIRLISFDHDELLFSCCVSKGTYIRQLAFDISKKLGTIGFLENLMRTKIDFFTIANAKKINDLKESDLIDFKSVALKIFPSEIIDENQIKSVINGGKYYSKKQDSNLVLLLDKANKILGIYEKDCGNIYKCKEGLSNFNL